MKPQETIVFRDLAGLLKWLKISLGALALVALLDACSSWLQITVLGQAQSGAQITDEAIASSIIRGGLVAILHMLVYSLTAILFLRWTYLTKKNATALGASGLAFSPGWSVGYYFIPVLTLWKPYQALHETFRASHPDFRENWESAPVPRLLPAWWTVWIIAGLVSQVLLRMTIKGGDSIPDLLKGSWINLLSTLIEIPLVALVWSLVSTMRDWQTAKFKVVASAETSTGP